MISVHIAVGINNIHNSNNNVKNNDRVNDNKNNTIMVIILWKYINNNEKSQFYFHFHKK